VQNTKASHPLTIMLNELTPEIEQTIAKAKALDFVGLDKKARNKVVARLEEAWLWSQHMYTQARLADIASQDAAAPACICPDGATDIHCPIHKTI